METGSADFINERLTSSIRDLKYQTICNQIMMESCTAKLAQANQSPMSILKLLWVNQWIGTDSYSAGIPGWVFDDDIFTFRWNHGGIQRYAAHD